MKRTSSKSSKSILSPPEALKLANTGSKQKQSFKRGLILPKLINEKSQFTLARIKGFKCKTFRLVDNSYHFYEENISKLLKTCRKMKYIRSFEIFFTAIFKIQKTSRFLRSITRLKSIHIEFGHILFFQQRFDKHRIDKLFQNLRHNLSSLHVEIFFGYGLHNSLAPSLVKSLIRGIKG